MCMFQVKSISTVKIESPFNSTYSIYRRDSPWRRTRAIVNVLALFTYTIDLLLFHISQIVNKSITSIFIHQLDTVL